LVKIRFEQPLLANSVVNLIDGYIFHLAALERGALCGKTVVRAGDGRRGRHQEHYVIGWCERAHPSLDSALEIFQSQRLLNGVQIPHRIVRLVENHFPMPHRISVLLLASDSGRDFRTSHKELL